MKKFLALLVLAALAATAVYLRYGAGEPYPDLTGAPLVDAAALEIAVRYPEGVGNVAVSRDGRLFFTVHPEARTEGNRLLEWSDGAAVPYPDGASQLELFDTVLGLTIDGDNRLWTIDHGQHGLREPRLLGFDLSNGEVVHDRRFGNDVAPAGSMLQDLRVSGDGRWIFIADASVVRQSPALIVYDRRSGQARRVLEKHPSVLPEDYLIRAGGTDMRWLGGLISLRIGVDGLALDETNGWLYYGAINHSGLFRLPLAALTDAALPDARRVAQIERVADKPLSDGLAAGPAGEVYVTDVEHGAIMRYREGRLQTLLRSERIRWADGLALGPGSDLYIADSALQHLVLRTAEHRRRSAPYYVYRLPLPAESRD
ncbi:MAG: L-dopachrome tautomerase-related protein [Woeseiaceae bacterium]|nr:L-dopachrome tautomerase-related protein [Woeseiaceae bacterium]